MTAEEKPLVLSAPEPRSLDLIFTLDARKELHRAYDVVEIEPDAVDELEPEVLSRVVYIIGQPPLAGSTIEAMASLRAIFNVESNLIHNMPYEMLFERGIHVLTTGAVFARPVAELGVALALNLARGVVDADLEFRRGMERWGSDGNQGARLLSGSEVGIIGFGDLGRMMSQILIGFRPHIRVHDPWLPPSVLHEAGVESASLDIVLSESDFVFVVASITIENNNLFDADAFKRMRADSVFILLSRAEIVDFNALHEAIRSGHIRAASDVFPEEPLAKNHPMRSAPNFLRSAHRAGALDTAFKQMGDMVLEDMDLMDRALPPMRCKRAERETVARMRSRPVDHN
jgi:phosphoglycerate dehydrogenase-like enzyme